MINELSDLTQLGNQYTDMHCVINCTFLYT